MPVDESGYGHHLIDMLHWVVAPFPVGPGILGRGGSFAADGNTYLTTADSKELDTSFFTVSLWLYLLQDSSGVWRTIFQKGSSAEHFAPALLLSPDERRLHVRLGFPDHTVGALQSSGVLPMRRWTHVVVVCGGDVLRLYINGLKDAEKILEGSWSGGEGPLHIGRDEWRSGTKAYLDDFRWYKRELSEGEVKALSFPSVTGIPSDFVQLGCGSCTYPEAENACKDKGVHVCSKQELYEGGYHVARIMGWLASAPGVWHQLSGNEAKSPTSEYFSGARKLGLCCEDP